jgi:hypothetical protein
MRYVLTFLNCTVLALSIAVTSGVFAQNITNILGTNGTFTIKSSSSSFFTLSQSNGEVNISKTLRLETTTGTNTGVLYMGSDKFLHNFGLACTYLGANSGNSFGGGILNTTAGHSTLFFNSTGSANAVLGYISLPLNSTGSSNSAFGYVSMFFNTEGNYNSAFGSTSLVNNSLGILNSAFGDSALAMNTTGDSNSAFGHLSLGSNTTGSQNTAFGKLSLFSNTTGSFNTAIGHISGSNLTTGNNVTCIGYASQPSTGTVSNQFTLGNNTLQSLRCNVTTITSLSDARDKTNIRDLPLGIDFIMTLKPRVYNWDKREWYENNVSDGSKVHQVQTAGFIAQELDSAQQLAGAEWLNLVMKDNPDKWEATPGNLLPVIIKAMQDLKAENEALSNENEALMREYIGFDNRLDELEKIQIIISEQENISLTGQGKNITPTSETGYERVQK